MHTHQFFKGSLIILIVIIFGFNKPLVCQRVSGQLLNSRNEPISFANIYLINLDTGTYSNANGFFSLPLGNIPTDTLSISHIGYESVNIPVVPTKKDMFDEYILSNKTFELNEVRVTALSEAQVLEKISSNMLAQELYNEFNSYYQKQFLSLNNDSIYYYLNKIGFTQQNQAVEDLSFELLFSKIYDMPTTNQFATINTDPLDTKTKISSLLFKDLFFKKWLDSELLTLKFSDYAGHSMLDTIFIQGNKGVVGSIVYNIDSYLPYSVEYDLLKVNQYHKKVNSFLIKSLFLSSTKHRLKEWESIKISQSYTIEDNRSMPTGISVVVSMRLKRRGVEKELKNQTSLFVKKPVLTQK